MGEHLTTRLAVLEADVTRVVRLAPAAEIRARGERRRWWGTRALVSLVAVVTASGFLAGGLGLLSAGGGGDTWSNFPAALRMPHEGERGWARNSDPSIASVFNPCGEADVTLPGRLDARTMTGKAFPDDPDPVSLTEQLFLYPDEATAQRVMDDLRTRAERDPSEGCGWAGGVYTGQLDVGADVLWSARRDDWRDVLMARHGRVIFVLQATGQGGRAPYNEDLASAQQIRERLCEAMGICGGPLAPTGQAEQTDQYGDPAPAPSWWDFLQTPHPLSSPFYYDPWEHLNPVPTPTP
jgi:hypothetical protein